MKGDKYRQGLEQRVASLEATVSRLQAVAIAEAAAEPAPASSATQPPADNAKP